MKPGPTTTFRSATDDTLAAVGTKAVTFTDASGHRITKKFQVSNKTGTPSVPVISVGEIADNNCTVVFQAGGGYIENNETKHKLYFECRRSIYEMQIDVDGKMAVGNKSDDVLLPLEDRGQADVEIYTSAGSD